MRKSFSGPGHRAFPLWKSPMSSLPYFIAAWLSCIVFSPLLFVVVVLLFFLGVLIPVFACFSDCLKKHRRNLEGGKVGGQQLTSDAVCRGKGEGKRMQSGSCK